MSRRRKSRKFGYDDAAPPQEQRATLPDECPTASSSRYKNRKIWCRGKIGGERHADHAEVRLEAHAARWLKCCSYPEYGHVRWRTRWICYHEEVCTNCGKILRSTLGVDCPNYPGSQTGDA